MGSWGGSSGSRTKFCSSQRSDHRPPFTQVVLPSARGLKRLGLPVLLGSGCPRCPLGTPARGGEGGGAVPCSAGRLHPLLGRTAIAQGCHPPPKKNPSACRSDECLALHLKVQDEHPPPSLGTSACPRGSPGLGQVPSGLVCPRQKVTVLLPHSRAS